MKSPVNNHYYVKQLERRNKENSEFHFCRCPARDYDKVMELQQQVCSVLPDEKLFVPVTEEELSESLCQDLCIGVYRKGELEAFSLLVLNRETPRSLGNYLDYTPEQLRRCVTYDATFVSPACRGYGIQRVLMGAKDKISSFLGAEEALATVSPENTYSYENLCSAGFTVAAEKNLYGGRSRYIMRKVLQ